MNNYIIKVGFNYYYLCRNLDEQLDDEDEQEVEGAVAPKVPKTKPAGKRKHDEEEEDDVLEKYNLDDYDDEDGNFFQKNSLSQTWAVVVMIVW